MSSASQNVGVEMPMRLSTRIAWSAIERCRIAATMPSPTPSSTDSVSAAIASSAVAGKAEARSVATGLRVCVDRPRSPCTSRLRYMPYCTGKGWSRPHTRSNAATAAGSLAWRSPSAAAAGLAGTSAVSTNVTSVTPQTSSTLTRSRRPM